MEALATLLGLGPAFVYAGAVVAMFFWIDAKVRDEVKCAFSDFILNPHYDKKSLTSAFLHCFAIVYGAPILSLRTFLRSALYTTIVSAFFLFKARAAVPEAIAMTKLPENQAFYLLYETVAICVLLNIVSDYLSLFIIRWRLSAACRNPIWAAISGVILGVLFVYLLQVVRMVCSIKFDFTPANPSVPPEFYVLMLPGILTLMTGLLVFLWFPLLVAGLALMRLARSFSALASIAQWLLKDGKEHPVIAVGYAAGAIVFIVTGAFRIMG